MLYVKDDDYDDLFLQHETNWEDCTRCPLSQFRKCICLTRGYVPAEVVFIGEAPGPFENMKGEPFVGPAGRKLDEIIDRTQRALEEEGYQRFTFAITNLVACYPNDGSGGFREPNKTEIEACSPRLYEFLRIVRPTLLVLLGKPATAAFKKEDDYHKLPLPHPSSIIRSDHHEETQSTLDCVSQLFNTIKRTFY